jgi:hypothetical protein
LSIASVSSTLAILEALLSSFLASSFSRSPTSPEMSTRVLSDSAMQDMSFAATDFTQFSLKLKKLQH